mgnify:CR=1 FL=1
MLKARLLLEKKLSTLPETKKKQFLLNCIEKHIPIPPYIESESYIPTQNINIDNETFCKICNKYNFIRDKYTEICQDCGFTRDMVPTQKNYEKIEYIKPGSNLVKIERDGKRITVDLNKINQWLQDTDPQARDTQTIINNLEIIFQGKSIELPKTVQNSSISLWYNFITLFEDYNGSSKKLYNKKAILALCVYYGSLINKYTVTLQQLSILFNVNYQDIIVTNSLFTEIFKDTDYNQYLILKHKKECNIPLSVKNKLLFEKIKNDLIQNFPNVNEPLENSVYAGIIYFITNKINPILKYTLKDIEERCNVSTTNISTKSKSIERFYKNNISLYKQLIS